jgi:pyruvate,orthophosphate dikinase
LQKILPLHQQDFFGLFKAMKGKPVTLRLLDPPLHEFEPKTKEEMLELANKLQIAPKKMQAKLAKLHEINPMLGHRGCRLAVTYPEIYDMQVEAITRAAVDCVRYNIPVQPEIMVPIVCSEKEIALLRPNAEKVIKRVLEETGAKLSIQIGTMIELPRAALAAGKIAEYTDFFSFGTNDLTQTVFGFSRDDAGFFLQSYLDHWLLEEDPFKTIDEEGVGAFVNIAVERGRATEKDLKIGICGEHGGDTASIDFFYRAGLNYVSCSPFRVPNARLAAAQAAIRNAAPKASKPAAAKADKPAAKGKAGRPAKTDKAKAKSPGRPPKRK